jgi:MFS family permease
MDSDNTLTLDKQLASITIADFIVRSAYQMGKTPLLPIFALTLGASDAYLGFIVSVSTLTGMILKPWIGFFSDSSGRRRWLLCGTAFFVVMPFLYRFVNTPAHLFSVRIVHGVATAIYGPVTLAYVAEQSFTHRAERVGWFSMARTAGYIVGPAVGGWLTLTLKPVQVYTLIGLFSCIAFIPILLTQDIKPKPATHRPHFRSRVVHTFGTSGRVPAIWLAGGLEASMYIATYALKAFLPVYAVSTGVSIALVGIFFSLQEATHLILKPWGGRLGDRVGHLLTIAVGLLTLSLTIPIIPIVMNTGGLLLPAVLMGLSEALIIPSSIALASLQLQGNNIGTGMGLIGTLNNAGKVVGPIMAGFLISLIDFEYTLNIIGGMLLIGAVVLLSHARAVKKKGSSIESKNQDKLAR